MIGRVEISEILGMAGSCAVLLFAGFSVETLQGNVDPTRLETVDVLAPDLPASVAPLDEIRLESPELEEPLHPTLPSVSPCT
ncbi:MAG: hypothetical protein Q8W46_06170 [Candidatus Palauibacterales bacterium]|nr:hypothetical protein [Candidatus Palauibacterales bacterium]